jgi:hypothetical protein
MRGLPNIATQSEEWCRRWRTTRRCPLRRLEPASPADRADHTIEDWRVLPSPQTQSNSRLAPVGEVHVSCFENLTKTSYGAGTYFFASLEANDLFGEQPSRQPLTS